MTFARCVPMFVRRTRMCSVYTREMIEHISMTLVRWTVWRSPIWRPLVACLTVDSSALFYTHSRRQKGKTKTVHPWTEMIGDMDWIGLDARIPRRQAQQRKTDTDGYNSSGMSTGSCHTTEMIPRRSVESLGGTIGLIYRKNVKVHPQDMKCTPSQCKSEF